MGKQAMNLQDSFLNQVRKDNTEIELVLLNGARLSGLVRGFDNFTVIVNSGGQQHLIYKHAIAQVISQRTAHYAEGEREGMENQRPRQHGPREGHPGHHDDSRKKDFSKERKFNTLDLSSVKIGDEAEAETEAEASPESTA